jgi:organic hydroperoxide reductase OsmC/OhrA
LLLLLLDLKICPYSHAARGNVDVAFDVIGG